MADGNKHVMVPILHPDGEVHQVLAPSDMPLADFHDFLTDYYHPKGPSAEGALENSPEFKDAAESAIRRGGAGRAEMEAGFVIDDEGKIRSVSADRGFQLNVPVSPRDFAVFHTHPDSGSSEPSLVDVNAAKKTNKPFYVASKAGLFMVRPSDGKVIHVFDSTEWYRTNNPKPGDGINPSHFSIRVALSSGRKINLDAGLEYPLDRMQKIRTSGIEGIAAKNIKDVRAFFPRDKKE